MFNKILKKFFGILGYKLLNKNYIKNKNFLFYKSDLKLKKIIEDFIKSNNISNIIQVGANDGKSFEDLSILIKKYSIESILIEPIKENFELLKKNYSGFKNVVLENSALSINNEILFLYKVDPNYYYKYDAYVKALPSFDFNHLIKHGVKSAHIIKEAVNQINFLELFNKNKIIDLDLLFIDGNHSFDAVCNDFNNYKNLVRKGGFIVFDDYGFISEVSRAVNHIDKSDFEIIGRFPLVSTNDFVHELDEQLNASFILKKK